MPRLFIAVDVPTDRSDSLKQLVSDALDARWVSREQYHLTLRFLGNVGDTATTELAARLRGIDVPAFQLSGRGIDVFPSRRRPRVLVACIEADPDLSALRTEIENIAVALGVEPDRKAFNPHVTFARLKGARPRDVRRYTKMHSEFGIEPFWAREFRLYRSDVGSDGAVHTVLEEYSLRSA